MRDRSFFKTENDALRDRSGNVKSTDPLAMFLYDILRDGCPPAVMEQALNNMLIIEEGEDCLFSNGYLANYSIDCAKRLRERI